MSAIATYPMRASFRDHMRSLILQWDKEVPQIIDGLSPEQFAVVARAQRHEPVRARAMITWALMGITWRQPLRAIAFYFFLTDEERFQLLILADPFMRSAQFSRTFLRSLRAGRMLVHCVHEDLLNQVDAEEWGRVDASFLQFQRTGDLDRAREMAAVLFVPLHTSRHDRLKPDGAGIPFANKLTDDQLHMIVLQWSGLRRLIEIESPDAFAKGKGGSQGAWMNVIIDMAGSIPAIEATRRVSARLFIAKLSRDIREREQRLRKAK